MVPASPRGRIALALVGVGVAFVVVSGSVNALPLFSDHTGPSRLTVSSFERLGAGCADEVADYARSHAGNGTYGKTTFIETRSEDADLSAWVERTSPRGADLSTFRVHVDSHGRGGTNETCRTGVQYRIEVTASGGSPAGIIPDAHGTRILWLENGRVIGCTVSVTSPLRAGCDRFTADDRRTQTWANATSG